MARPTLPAPDEDDVWGTQLNAAINDVSDRIDTKQNVVVLEPDDPDPDPILPGILYVRVAVADVTPPGPPTGLAASDITQTSFVLNWTAPTDNVGVTVYQVRVNGILVASPTTNNATVGGRTANTGYSVEVRAGDAAGNWSSNAAITVTTNDVPAGTPRHSIWATNAPAGSWNSGTDATPNIEAGNCFYRYGAAPGWWASSRMVGMKLYKDPGITLPSGAAELNLYTNTGALPGAPGLPPSFGTLVATKQIAAPVDGWNTVYLDTPIAMPANAAVVVVTVKYTGNLVFYAFNTLAKGAGFLGATDGTKLVWSDDDGNNGYRSNLMRIGTTMGTALAATTSYGTDLIIDEGP